MALTGSCPGDFQHARQDVAGLLGIEVRVGLNRDLAEFLGFGGDAVAHGSRIGEDDVGAVVVEGAGHGAAQSGIGEARVVFGVVVIGHAVFLGGGVDALHKAVGIHEDPVRVGAADEPDAAALIEGGQAVAGGEEGGLVLVELDREIAGQIRGLMHVEQNGGDVLVPDGSVVVDVRIVVEDHEMGVRIFFGERFVAATPLIRASKSYSRLKISLYPSLARVSRAFGTPFVGSTILAA